MSRTPNLILPSGLTQLPHPPQPATNRTVKKGKGGDKCAKESSECTFLQVSGDAKKYTQSVFFFSASSSMVDNGFQNCQQQVPRRCGNKMRLRPPIPSTYASLTKPKRTFPETLCVIKAAIASTFVLLLLALVSSSFSFQNLSTLRESPRVHTSERASASRKFSNGSDVLSVAVHSCKPPDSIQSPTHPTAN